jgi:hypothetical protein
MHFHLASNYVILKHWVKDTIWGHPHHHAIIDTSSIKSPENSELSKRDKMNRAVYGLYKLRQFNIKFFSPQERFYIDPKPIGIFRILQYGGACLLNASVVSYCVVRKDFRPIWLLRIGGLLAVERLLWELPDRFNEIQRFNSRWAIAQKYNEAYGEDFLLDIAKPSYDYSQLEDMKNKLWR